MATGLGLTPEVGSDAVPIYFAHATLTGAFVARWCAVSKVERAGGVFQVRKDEPPPRVGAAPDAVRSERVRPFASQRPHH